VKEEILRQPRKNKGLSHSFKRNIRQECTSEGGRGGISKTQKDGKEPRPVRGGVNVHD